MSRKSPIDWAFLLSFIWNFFGMLYFLGQARAGGHSERHNEP